MKIAKIGILASVLVLGLFAFVTPMGHAQSATVSWTGKVVNNFGGYDPFFGTTVTAYSASGTASLTIALRNFNSFATVKMLSLKLDPDWGTNTTNFLSSPITLASNGNPSYVSGSLPIPAIGTGSGQASNMILHTVILYANYNTTEFGSTSTSKDANLNTASLAIYNSDQTAFWQSLSQLPVLSANGQQLVTPSCSSFKTSQGNSKCQQAVQAATEGFTAYQTGDFSTANTDMANAVSDYNSAVSTDSSTGGGLDLANTLGSYGGLLLGIGALIGGIAAILYAIRKPKMMATTAPHM